MDLSLRKSWKSRCFMHLANYPSRSSPTNFGDETKFLSEPEYYFHAGLAPETLDEMWGQKHRKVGGRYALRT
jgi:hypothetical protein